MIINCVGDSHVSVFGGIDKISEGFPSKHDKIDIFKTYRIGPFLAYNISNKKHQSNIILKKLINSFNNGDYLLLSFGEIDCRYHLIKQSIVQNRDLFGLVDECCGLYCQLILELYNAGKKLIIWNAPATSNYNDLEMKLDEKTYPHYGDYVQRNKLTERFNQNLLTYCKKYNILFLTIFEKLIDENYKTKYEYYYDTIHLSQKVMPWIMDDIQKKLIWS
jgi:hypothetical protein